MDRDGVIEGYHFDETLHAGGLLSAYRVRPEGKEAVLTLWTLSLVGVSEEEDLPRRLFERFARLKLLDHPNLLQIIDFGQSGEIFYWLTPPARGERLSSLLKSKDGSAAVWTEKKVAAFVDEITGALDLLWSEGLLHGALSPDTVVVDEAGHPQVYQYGWNDLFLVAENARVPVGEWSLGLAHPAYCAPEQALGRDVDWRVDQFALGALAATLLFGRSPYTAAHPAEAALRAASPLRWPESTRQPVRPSVTMRRWIARCALQQPKDRFKSAEDLRRPLARLSQGRGSYIPLRRGALPPLPLSRAGRATRTIGTLAFSTVMALAAWGVLVGALFFTTQGVQVAMVGPLSPLASHTATSSPTVTPTITVTPTLTATPTFTATPAVTETATAEPTPAATATRPAMAAAPSRTPPPPADELPPAPNNQVVLWDHSLPAPSLSINPDTAGSLRETRRLGLGRFNQITSTSDWKVKAIATMAGVLLRSDLNASFLAFEDEVSAVLFSPEDTLLAVGLDGGEIQIWRWQEAYELAARFEGHTGRVEQLVFSPDGKRLVSVSADGSARIWLLGEGREEKQIDASTKPLKALAISPDGSTIATGGEDSTVRLWTISGEKLFNAPFSQPVTALAFDPDRPTRFAVGGAGGNLAFWDMVKRREVSNATRLTRGGITNLDYGPTSNEKFGLRIATNDTVVWGFTANSEPNDQNNLVVVPLREANRPVYDAWVEDRKMLPSGFEFRASTVFDRGSTNFASIRWDGFLSNSEMVWEPLTPERFQFFTRMATSEDGAFLGAGGNGRVQIFSVADGSLRRSLIGTLPPGSPFSFTNGDVLIVAGLSPDNKKPTAWLYNLRDGEKDENRNMGDYPTGAQVRFRADGQILVQSNGMQSGVVDLASMIPAIFTIANSGGCPSILSTADNHPVMFYTPWSLLDENDERTQGLCRLVRPNNGRIGAISPDRAHLAVATQAGTLQVYNSAGGELAWETQETFQPQWLLYSPSGDLLVAGMPAAGKLPDGDLLTAGMPGGARVYHAATGDLLAELNAPSWGLVTAAVFSPDGLRLYLAAQDGIIHQFEVHP